MANKVQPGKIQPDKVRPHKVQPRTGDRCLGDFAGAFRRAGLRATHQRMEIFRQIAGSRGHPDADAVFQSVRKRMPTVSRDTVYRALALLEQKGLIRKVDAFYGRARYDGNTENHHHFICKKCGRIRDFHWRMVDDFIPPQAVRRWGQIETVQLQLRGTCAQCRTKERIYKTYNQRVKTPKRKGA